MTLRKRILILSGAAFLLAGCSDFGTRWDDFQNKMSNMTTTQPEIAPTATEPDVVTLKLAQAADKASAALDSIANIEQQKNPATQPLNDDYSNASPNVMQPVTIRWSGPIEQISRVLAERAGMRFRVKGREPAAPLTVNIDAYQEPILHVLRDVGLQAGSRADLAIDQNEGVIEVRYAAADASTR
jgi:defect-in-organelle-trafficking protein DotD